MVEKTRPSTSADPVLINSTSLDENAGLALDIKCQPIQNDAFPQNKFRSIEIYKFADGVDIVLMIIGTVSSFASGVCFPLLLIIYQQVTDALVNFGKMDYIQENISQNASQLSCENGGFDIPDKNNTKTPIQAIQDVVPMYVLVGFLSIVFYTIAFSSYLVSAERQIRRIRFRLFRHILYQDMSFFDVLDGKGKLTNTLTNDLLKMKEGMGDKVADFLSLLARMIGCLIFSLIKGWKLTLVILAIAPLVIVAFNLTIKFTIKYTKKQILAYGKANSIAQEVLTAIRTVTAFNGQKKEYQRYATSLSSVPRIGLRKGLVQGLCQIFSNIATGMVFTVALWYGQYLIKTECHTYSAGKLVVIFIACLNTTWCLNQIVPSLEKFADATAAGSYVFALLSQKSKIDGSKSDEGEKPPTLEGEVRFRNVSFHYPARPTQTILRNLNLTIPSGKTVAFVGRSGCGKSTALSLICRLYDPAQGQILFDNRDVRQLNIQWYRSQIGYVGQEPILFEGSIEENIRLGKPNATETEMHQAAMMANAHDFIMALPKKYRSSAKGVLSGGQKQRIAIARALISNPRIVLLDEATAALDTVSEEMVKRALINARTGRTVIIIAHRLTTVKDADLIFVFDKGNIAEQGTHEELLQIHHGIYQKLASQFEVDEHENENEGDVAQESIEGISRMERQLSKSSSLRVARPVSTKRNIQKFRSPKRVLETKDDEGQEEEEEKEDVTQQSCCHQPFFVELLKLNAPEKYHLLIGCICSFLFGAVEPAVGFLYSKVYALFAIPNLENQSIDTRNYSLGIFGIYVFAGIAQFLSTITFANAGEELTSRMRLATFQAMLRREMSWFDWEENSVGSLGTRLSTDTAAFRGLIGVRLNALFSSLGAFILALILAFMAGWKLTLVVLCFSPLLILSGYLQGRTQSKAGQSKVAKSMAEVAGRCAIEAIQGIRTVVTLNQEQCFVQKYEQAFNTDFRNRVWKLPIEALGKGIANSFLYFIHVTAFGYGASLVEKREMQFSQVFQVFIVINFASMSIGRSTSALLDYNVAKAAALRILTICNQKSLIDPDNGNGIKLDTFSGKIEFKNVHFAYPTRANQCVLNRFDLACQRGKTTGLVGFSGCGKSTTVSLLLRFYDSINGRILLDNHDIKTLNISWLRSIIGLVQQEPVLFDITIAENIAYGINDRQISLEEIQEAAKQANIHEEILLFPQAYETMCGIAGNSHLSGGQKQRIAIARALLRKPQILLLDEATSALDNTSESIVQKAIDQIQHGRTCLTIAHRLTTIQNCENIVVVNHGQVVEQGVHEELLQKKGLYYKMQQAYEQRPAEQ